MDSAVQSNLNLCTVCFDYLTCRNEYCVSVEDFLARRTRLAFLDVKAAEEAVQKVRPLKPVL